MMTIISFFYKKIQRSKSESISLLPTSTILNPKNSISKLVAILLCLLSISIIASGQSKYFPKDAWGVYSWAGWKPSEVTPKTHPLIKGVPLIIKWNQLEPKQGNFEFEKQIFDKLELADKYKYNIFIMVWVAPDAPRWLYANGVTEVEMTKTLNPLGKPRNDTYQYYLDEDYVKYYHRMLTELGTYLLSLPENLRKRVLYIQSAEGSTGDGDPYKGEPIDKKYEITKAQWGDFRIDAWRVMKKSLTNQKGDFVIPILVNFDANSEKQHEWLLNNLPIIGLKNGMFSHGYDISETKTRLASWKDVRKRAEEKGVEVFSRGEQDGEWKVYGWSTKNTPQAFYWSGIFAAYCGLDMWNVPSEAAEGNKHEDGIKFFNKYGGENDASTAKSAFCALRKGLDAADIKSYPEDIYGKCDRKNIDRYLKIAAAFRKFGAYQGDPEKAIGGGMMNRKSNDYNDVGWDISDGNYSRYIDQIDAEETTDGWWHVSPKESIYSRFARSFKLINGKGGMYFDVNDDFAKSCKKIELKIIWLDQGKGEWEVKYNSENKPNKSLFKIKNNNTGKWQEKIVLVNDASFKNKGDRKSDVSITTKSKETTTFHLVEITKK